LFREEPGWAWRAQGLAQRTFELTEFLVKKLGRPDLGASFSGRVAWHDSCQVGRALDNHDSGPALLENVRGTTLAGLVRPDACCGFGGQFAFQHPEISEALLDEKIADIAASGATHVATAEVSCLLNIRGRLQKIGSPLKALHIAEVLAGEGA